MDNLFEQFVKDEMDWICNDDMINILLDNFDGEITEEELEDNMEVFINQAANRFCNNEYIIQTLHDWMHDEVSDVVKEYISMKGE